MSACPGSFPAFAVADSVGLLARRNFAAQPSRPGMQDSGSRGISPALQSRGGDGFAPSSRHGVCGRCGGAMLRVNSSLGFSACGKTQIFVIPRRAARRGISLLLHLNRREIPRFARNDKLNYFFRSLFSLHYKPRKSCGVKKNRLRNILAAARSQIHARPSRGTEFHIQRRVKHLLQ